MKNNLLSLWGGGGLEFLESCPVCHDEKKEKLFSNLSDITFNCSNDTWDFYKCQCCGSAYINPRPDCESINKAYVNYYTHKRELQKTFFSKIKNYLVNGYLNNVFGTKNINSWSIGFYLVKILDKKRRKIDAEYRHIYKQKPGKLLDIGCGNGEFLSKIRSAGWEIFGIDPDEKAIKVALDNGVEARIGTIEDLNINQKFDVITASHVIEHVHSPRFFLEECLARLNENGYLWIETPNIESNGLDIYGEYWRGLEVPRHLILFSQNSVVNLLKEIGFSRVEIMPYRPLCKDMFKYSDILKNGGELDLNKYNNKSGSYLNYEIYEEISRKYSEKREFINVKAFK